MVWPSGEGALNQETALPKGFFLENRPYAHLIPTQAPLAIGGVAVFSHINLSTTGRQTLEATNGHWSGDWRCTQIDNRCLVELLLLFLLLLLSTVFTERSVKHSSRAHCAARN